MLGHYADIKYGQLSGQNGVADTLQVITGGKSIWSVTPVKGTWVGPKFRVDSYSN